MANVLDYSWARPGAATIRAGGYIGAMRYLSGGGGKDLTAGERDELLGAGLEIGLVWETTATRMNGGAPAGADDARRANNQATNLGFPGNRPIYFANDQNAAWNEHVDYMRGARDNSSRPVGVYGSTDLVNRCHDELGVNYGWKVSTWGGACPLACLIQQANWPPTIGGTDINSVERADWGQWNGAAPEPPPPKQRMEQFFQEELMD